MVLTNNIIVWDLFEESVNLMNIIYSSTLKIFIYI